MPLSIITSLSDLPSSLVDDFASGDGLLWTGAGVSRRQEMRLPDGQLVQAGVPAAAALEAHLRTWTPEPHPSGAGFEQLATVYVQRLGRPRLNRLLRAIYLRLAKIPPAFYERIARLPSSVRLFVTTNYDPFLERALVARQPSVVIVEAGLEAVSNRTPAVYKVHGDGAHPETCVITTPDYDRWEREAGQLREKVSTLFMEHTVVALGYRAQDGNFRRLLGTVNSRILARVGHPRALYVVGPDVASENFAAYDVPEHDVVLVRATGEEFLDWLIGSLTEREREAEADALSRLVDPPTVRTARSRVQMSRPNTMPADDGNGVGPSAWSDHGEAQMALAESLFDAGRPSEAIRTLADAARAFRIASAEATADDVAKRAYSTALRRRDARLAGDLQQRMTFPVVGTQRVPTSVDADVTYSAALADALSGEPGDPPAVPTAWEAALAEQRTPDLATQADRVPAGGAHPPKLAGGTDEAALAAPSRECLAEMRYRVARLRAEHAITMSRFSEAAAQFREAATHAPSSEEVAENKVRGELFSGLADSGIGGGDDRRQAIGALKALAVPDAIEPLRQRAESWLAALQGDLTLASEGFVEAARRALGRLDAVAAAGAYRSAEWVKRQSPILEWSDDRPGLSAYRLESTVARAPHAARVGVHELLEEAEERLRNGKVREAWLAAMAAQRLAYDDVDPGNAYLAQQVLAQVWERTIVAGGGALGDLYSVQSATLYGACVHAELDDDERSRRAEVLARGLNSLADPAQRVLVLAGVSGMTTSRAERTSAIMLLADLAPVLDPVTVQLVAVPLLLTGLADGWSMSKSTNAARAACRLLEAILNRLTPAAAGQIRDTLAAHEGDTPVSMRDEFYIALAQAADRAGAMPDGGRALADQLLGTLSQLRAALTQGTVPFRDQLGVALAAVALQAQEDVRGQIAQELEREAAALHRGGLAILAARGAPLPIALLDEYLREITARMRALTASGSAAGFGMGLSHDPRLTQRAGADASESDRSAAVDAVIALLAEDRQREVVREPWVGCSVYLARGTRERASDIIEALLRIADGSYTPSGLELPFGDHPLSGMRVTGLEVGGLRANALIGIGALWALAASDQQSRIRDALTAALLFPDTTIRTGAIHGVTGTIRSLSERQAAAIPVTSGWQVEVLVATLADPIPAIQELAREALVTLARGEPDE